MKKILFLLGGVIFLTACSEDVIQNTDLESVKDSSSTVKPFTNEDGCPTPWDFGPAPGNQVEYVFTNQTGDLGSPSLLTLRATPYVGLAYFDGDNTDGQYLTHAGYTPLTTGMYPHLYAGNNEIGNFIPAAPIIVDGTGIPSYYSSVRLQIQGTNGFHHCPVTPNVLSNATQNPAAVYFNLPGAGTPVTPQEIQLLEQYGKVFFYYCEAIDPATNAVVWSNYLMLDCDDTKWTDTTVTANVPVAGSSLFYNTVSAEVVLPNTTFPFMDTFSYAPGATTYNYTVSLLGTLTNTELILTD